MPVAAAPQVTLLMLIAPDPPWRSTARFAAFCVIEPL
jgi:hypothetical protein